MSNQENVLDQLDPKTRHALVLPKISLKLREVSKALKGCETVIEKLTQAVDIIAKSSAIQQVERTPAQMETQQNGHPCE